MPEKANILAAQYKATPYPSLDELLEAEKDLQLISICTPNGLHAQHTIQSLKAGLHVLCEKPLCTRTEDGAKMVETAAATSRKLFVVKSTRYNPMVREVKQLLDSNRLGEVYSFQLSCIWNRPKAYYADSWKGDLLLDGGTLFTQFSHYIDVLIWFFGQERTILGFRKNAAHGEEIAFEDTGVLAVEMLSGALGSIHYSVNAFEKNQEVSLTIVAANGTIKLGGEFMNELIYQQPAFINPAALATAMANYDRINKGSMSNHYQVYENVMLALSGGNGFVTDGNDALKTVSFIEKCYQHIHF